MGLTTTDTRVSMVASITMWTGFSLGVLGGWVKVVAHDSRHYRGIMDVF